MMGFGGVGYGGAWLWMLAGVLFVVGMAPHTAKAERVDRRTIRMNA